MRIIRFAVRRKYVAWLAAGIAGAVLVFSLQVALHNRDTAARRAVIRNLQEIDKAIQSDVVKGELIAHYRLDTNGNDSLGKSPPLVVINGDQSRAGFNYPASFVISNAPFTNGVLYIDGRYEPNGHFIKYLSTAAIEDLRYESFTVALDFYPLPNKRGRGDFNKLERKLDSWTRSYYARLLGFNGAGSSKENILTGGYSYRWLGFNRKHGLLNLTLNNQTFVHQFKDAVVKPGRWHNLLCSVDLQRKKILTFFDGHPLEEITLPPDFKLEVIGSPADATDREFTFANYSNGSVFYGYAAHLKLLRRALTESELASLYDESLRERPTFPKPQFPWPPLVLMLAIATVALALPLWRRKQRGLSNAAQQASQSADVKTRPDTSAKGA